MPKKVVTTKPVTVKPQPPKQQSLQFSLFDKFDENDVKAPTNDCLSAESAEMTGDTKEETTSVKTPTKPVVEENKGNDMYQKYMSYQAEHKTAIVAYRLGDFYEVFGDNAVTLGNELSLTIGSRYTRILWDIGSLNLKQSTDSNMFLVTDLGIHIAVCYCRRTCLFRP